MSGALSVPNTFANAVTATGLQLDTNFNTITAYINDPTNRNNYAADSSGSTNTIALSFTPSVTAYTAGLEITFKAAIGNTGAVVVNANSLGNKNLFNAAGTALTGGEITSNQIVSAAYDGTQFQMLSGIANFVGAASQAQQETATLGNVFVSPATQKFSPLSPKAVATWSGTATGTITADFAFGVSSIVKGGTGTFVVSLSSAFSSPNWGWLANHSSVGNGVSSVTPVGLATSQTITILCAIDTGAVNPVRVNFAAFGDLP